MSDDENKIPDFQNAQEPPESQEPDIQAPELPEPELQLEEDDLVIFGEDGRFYYVKRDQYTDPACRLPDKFRATPEFMVGLGTVVADVTVLESVQAEVSKQAEPPTPLLVRCSCVVLNVAAIRRKSEKKKDKKEPVPILEKAKSASAKSGLEPQPEDLVIFEEDQDFYLVKRDVYATQEIPPALKSAPLLMVELGTVVADIPRLPTAGSACKLLNLAFLRKDRSELARLIRDQKIDQEIAARVQTLTILQEERDALGATTQRAFIRADEQTLLPQNARSERSELLNTRIRTLEDEVAELRNSKSNPTQE
jgi:hypothetical protein